MKAKLTIVLVKVNEGENGQRKHPKMHHHGWMVHGHVIFFHWVFVLQLSSS
jgi:hypothetical protein